MIFGDPTVRKPWLLGVKSARADYICVERLERLNHERRQGVHRLKSPFEVLQARYSQAKAALGACYSR